MKKSSVLEKNVRRNQTQNNIPPHNSPGFKTPQPYFLAKLKV
jgi:hypothetical protein